MKKHIKILTIFLALTMLMALALPAAADSLGNNGSITITPSPSYSLTAEDFEAYLLFTLTGINGAEYVYEPVPGIVDFLAEDGMAEKYGASGLTGSQAAEAFRQWIQSGARNDEEIIELARDLATYVSDFAPVSSTQRIKDSNKNIVFSDLDYGWYLVTGSGLREDTKGFHSENVFSRGILTNIPCKTDGDPNTVIKLKADAPKIDKQVWNHNFGQASKDTAGWKNWTDVNIGDTVYFKHISTIPDMTDYASYTYKVHDIMSPGLTFVPESISVKLIAPSESGKSDVTFEEDTDFTLGYDPIDDDEYGDGSTYITIDFLDFLTLCKGKAGWTIEIIYEAVLNEDAVVGAPGNPNRVYLEYSNNPYDENSHAETPEDDATVYTFDLVIYKYTGTTIPGTKLPGAEFELSRKTGAETYGGALSFVELTDDADGYDYRLAISGDTDTTETLVTNADGYIRIKGLDAGDYGLKETKAPAGYNLLPGLVSTIIVHKNDAGSYSLTVDGTQDKQAVNVRNNTGGQLPITGGIGTYIFFGVGGAMALLLTIVFITYKRRKTLDTLNNA